MYEINSKLPNIETSIFAAMSKLANETGAINLSQGFPDWQCSERLINLVNKYMVDGHNQYAPMPGVPILREALAAKVNSLYKSSVKMDEITITAGATQAIYTSISSIINEDDEVIVFEPAYDSYVPAILMNKGIPKYIQLKAPDYKIDWQKVKSTVCSKTKMIIINTPHNPTGSVLNNEDMIELQSITRDTDITIISDEVYEHITLDGIAHESILKYPELAARSMAIFSFGKVFHATGWKMGYCIAPKFLTDEFQRLHQFVVYACNTPVQNAFAEFLLDPSNYLNLPALFQKKRDYFLNKLSGSAFKIAPARGTYFQLLDYSDISQERDTEFANRLTREIGVASIPISVFYHNKLDNYQLRFCFAKSEEMLAEAAEKLLMVSQLAMCE